MKTKTYWILAAVSLFSIAGSVMPAGGTKEVSAHTVISRQSFLAGLMASKFAAIPSRFTSEGSADILEGLEAVRVIVERLSPKVEKYELRVQELQTDTELRLRQYGIKVVTQEERFGISMESAKRDGESEARMTILIMTEPSKPLEEMEEPYKSLFEHVENAINDKNIEYHLLGEGVKNFLNYNKPPSSAARLYINILPVIMEDIGLAVVDVSIQLQESVILKRDRSVSCSSAVTWEQDILITCGLDKLSKVRLHVRDLVDKFINDYLSANPKSKNKGQK